MKTVAFPTLRFVGIVLLSFLVAAGQATAPLSFEVASVKPAGLPPRHIGLRIDAGLVDIGAVPLDQLIALAYRVKRFQISGPGWLALSAFDIAARIPEGSSVGQVPEMLRSLLEDRFKLTVHEENRAYRVYALVIDKGGLRIKSPTEDPAAPMPAGSRAMTIGEFATQLSDLADRPVINMTGVEGQYVLRLKEIEAGYFAKSTLGGSGSEPFAIKAAEEAGFRMESRKISMPVFVIDHIEKNPTRN